jgi:hypothetical protein
MDCAQLLAELAGAGTRPGDIVFVARQGEPTAAGGRWSSPTRPGH